MHYYSDEFLALIEDLKRKAEGNRLEKSLARLYKSFNTWKKKEIDSKTLASHIREWYFINQESTSYTAGSDPGLPVAQALTDGYLRASDIPPELMAQLELLIEIMKV